jgi:eukaryotic-like serine/threonine-protein kinase
LPIKMLAAIAALKQLILQLTRIRKIADDQESQRKGLIALELFCGSCNRRYEYDSTPPKFCSECGAAISGSIAQIQAAALREANTLPLREANTVPPKPQLTTSSLATLTHEASEVIGPYRLSRLLGRGGMGVVWEAEELANGRRVALKLLARGLMSDSKTVERFVREGRLAAQLSHHRTTFVYGAGAIQGQPYIAMELMPGDTLQDLLDQQQKLPVNKAVDYVLDVIEGLLAAHELGIVHRDVKPSNCFLTDDGRVKVGDFGLSKSLVTEVSLTQTGTFMGTPLFAAPEQIRGGDVDQRTDIYSVGATLFTLIAGKAPFSGDALSVTAQIVSDRAPPISKYVKGVPKSLERIIQKTLEKDPANRFQTLSALREAMAPFASGGTSIADVGRRTSAYMIDVALLGIMIQLLTQCAGGVAGARIQNDIGNADFDGEAISQIGVLSSAISWIVTVGYFASCESAWGKTLGKRLLKMQVVDMKGERPSVLAALCRSLFIPGVLGFSLLIPIWNYCFAEPETFADFQFDEQLFSQIGESIFGYIPLVISLLFMTRKNGFRGLHELASGTRVVRIVESGLTEKWDQHPIIAPKWTESTQTYGPYRVIGILAQKGDWRLLSARDDVLNRSIWLEVRPAERASEKLQPVVNRSGRIRWLQDGVDGGLAWTAYESIAGVPFGLLTNSGAGLSWKSTHQILQNLVQELLVSIADGSIPSDLSIDHVWVDRVGSAKLLNQVLIPTHGNSPGRIHRHESAEKRAVELLVEIAKQCVKEQHIPVSASRFVQDLARRDESVLTLEWAKQELQVLSEKPKELTRDVRLGILCIAMGIETPLVSLTYSGLTLGMRNTALNPAIGSYVAGLITLFCAAAVAYAIQGAPVFNATKLRIMRSNGTPAGRTRCAIRQFLTWLPFITILSISTPFVNWSVEFTQAQNQLKAERLKQQGAEASASKAENQSLPPVTKEGNSQSEQTASPNVTSNKSGEKEKVPLMSDDEIFWILGSLCILCVMYILYLFGPLFSVLRPEGGLQDFLARTRLTPD